MRFHPVDTEAEHHRILGELGLLDDLENWTAYQAQEERFFELDQSIPDEVWKKHFIPIQMSSELDEPTNGAVQV